MCLRELAKKVIVDARLVSHTVLGKIAVLIVSTTNMTIYNF